MRLLDPFGIEAGSFVSLAANNDVAIEGIRCPKEPDIKISRAEVELGSRPGLRELHMRPREGGLPQKFPLNMRNCLQLSCTWSVSTVRARAWTTHFCLISGELADLGQTELAGYWSLSWGVPLF